VQIAVMAAVGMGLHDAGAMERLAGDVVLFAVPAEEFVELAYRDNLRAAGAIRYFGGKPELIRLGCFDDIDMALQMHVDSTDNAACLRSGKGYAALTTTSNGFIGKLVHYTGCASHAAASPDKGVNALQAALLGLTGVNALRETFKDSDHVRFHPIITHGGDLVNVTPSDVRMESYVRAASVEALCVYNEKINKALAGGATAVGAEVEIRDLPGYLPLCADANLNDLFGANMADLLGKDRVVVASHLAGSTDTGDLCHIMPVCHPWIAGVRGTLHGKSYAIFDEELIYIEAAKAIAMTVIDLLYGDGEEAARVRAEHKTLLTKQGLLDYLESVNKTEVYK
jgi:metal-dependent amidase/aminoacylase/carboxypeptidase family protein